MSARRPAPRRPVRAHRRAAAPRDDRGTTPPREVELEIASIAAGGDGVGRADGLVVFTPRTAPGDRVRVRATPAPGGRFARGELIALLHASEARVEPACPHYAGDRCGGCQLQHLRYDAQLAAKRGIVQDALTRIARRPISDVVVHPSPAQWRYRRKLTLALRRSRSGTWIAGLHRYDAPDEVFDLEDCPITETAVVSVWRSIRDAADLLPDGDVLRAAVRATDGGYAFVVEGGRAWPNAGALATAVPALTEIWWTPDDGHRRRFVRPVNGGPRVAVGAPRPEAGASFVQINREVSAALRDHVVARALAYAPAHLIDAYAGTGATAAAIARREVRVTAIEADAEAVGQCASKLPDGSRAVAARVEDVLAAELPADVVILNPPRQGVSAAVTSMLIAARPAPRAILYVSCDPATLARDVARLAGWRVAAVEAFDMFPQTAHVETVCELVADSGVAA
jgi:23S rRNA (uracil1939-C5)-methyltransferase